MGLFNKLANILFDEEVEEEIPVITKSEENVIDDGKDQIRITKVEVKKEEKREEPKEYTRPLNDEPTKVSVPKIDVEEHVETKRFSFPFIDDDDEEEMPTRSAANKTIEDYSYASPGVKEEKPKKTILTITDKKNQKSDTYTASRNNIYDTTKKNTDDKKPFTLSPIISPVYGILNENYTKDDIVEKSSKRNDDKIDFDSVRRKAYGTLEDEIESSLSKSDDILDEVPTKEEMSIDTLKDDGLSLSDLLVSEDETEEKTGELFKVEELEDEVLDEDTIELNEEENTTSEFDDIEEEKEEIKEVKKPKKIDKEEVADEEDDLFDLIDSIYKGKEEE